MCGIGGTFDFRDGVRTSPAELNCIAQCIALRGPDGHGTWSDGGLQFAHSRLAILDPTTRSDQPMVAPDGSLAIVFNGEIYNFKMLRDRLEALGHVFRTEGDTEVLLACYREYGRGMVNHLRGMYAFAVWDAREQTLFAARDPLGIKPFYYSIADGMLRFASQVKALRAVTGERELHPAGQVGFLLWGSVPEPFTIYRAIRALPAGHTLVARRGEEPQLARFDDLASMLADAAEHWKADRRSAERILHESLRESVAAHLVSDVPVALFLSAGLDSCTIAALLAEIPGARPHALTLGFDQMRGGPLDETGLAEQVAQQYGIPFASEYVERAEFAREHDHLLTAMDQPSIDGVNVYFVSRMAHRHGYKVALSGLGGDEIFAGYGSFRQVPKLARMLKPFASYPALGRSFRWMSGKFLKRFTSPKYAGLLEYGTSIEGAYLLRRSLYMPWELPGVLDPEVAREGWQELEPLARMQRTLAPLNGVRGAIGDRLRVTSLEMTRYMRNQLLRDADWAGMAHSVEVRVPLMDYTLLRTLAPLLSSASPPGKRQMATIPEQRLPEAILRRPKTGFEVPVREWLLNRTGQPHRGAERGLRGWAQHVLQTFR